MGLLYFKETLKYFLRSRLYISKYVKEVERLYGMSPEKLREQNEKRFLEIFRLAYTRSPFYSRLYKEHGIRLDDIQTLQDIDKLPVVTKDMFREHPEELLTCAKWRTWKNHTSGTTGTPLTVYESWQSIWREQAYNYYYRKQCGYVYGKQVLASLRGHLNRTTKTLFVHTSKTLYLSSFQLNEDNILDYYKKIIKYKPKAIEGYPSSLVQLCLLLRKKGLNCNIPIIFTSSETLLPIQRNIIEKVLSGQVYDHYGTTERTIALSERKDHDGYVEAPAYSINEFKKGHVITTSLINKAFPLIRYRIDDAIVTQEENNRKKVVSIDGRSMDYVTGKDGTQFNAAALTYVAKAVPQIVAVQLVQQKRGELQVNVIPMKDFDERSKEKGLEAIYERIGKGNMDVVINIITEDDLIYTKRGKLSLIINKNTEDA